MTVTTPGLASALQSLGRALDSFREPEVPLGHWRWRVRQRMADVRDALVADDGHATDGWAAARQSAVQRQRDVLLARLGALGPRVLHDPDAEAVRADLRRLVIDAGHHAQRVHDLAYDEVELELGGSE